MLSPAGIVRVYSILFILSPADGHLGCFHLGPVAKDKAAVQVSAQPCFMDTFPFLSGVGMPRHQEARDSPHRKSRRPPMAPQTQQ